jgi:hypothetical protein
MLKDALEAIGLLSLIALPILFTFCIVGSIVAALRAVSRAGHAESTKL